MEKYDNVSLDNMSRTKRNESIYNSTDIGELSRIKTNTNVSVISDAPKEIDLEKIKNYVNSLNEEKEEKRKRISLELPEEEEVVVTRKEEKDYDINSVLERARDNREVDYEEERRRKINNTQIDILKNIKIKDEQIEIEKDPDITESIEELNTEEKTIVDLIKDIQSNSSKSKKKDLFEDLMGDGDDTIVAPIEEEATKDNIKEALFSITQDLESIMEPENEFTHEINVEKEAIKESKNNEEEIKKVEDTDKIDTVDLEGIGDTTTDVPKVTEVDKSFYTNSMSFSKTDFEGFEDLEKGVKKSSAFTKIAIGVIILLLIATVVLILNFVFDWNLL